MISAQEVEIDATIQNCIDVSSRSLPKDIASDQSNDSKEFLDYGNSESQHQFSELNNPCTENLETIFSPAFEPTEVRSQHYTEKGSFGDANMAGVGADEGRNICDFETLHDPACL
jgi:CTD small phosphatase-like protein 2